MDVLCTLYIAGNNADLHLVWMVGTASGIANIAATIGGYTCNSRKIRIVGMLINSPLWIIYDIAVGSWAGILDEIVSEASMMISIFRYGWKNMDSLEIEA